MKLIALLLLASLPAIAQTNRVPFVVTNHYVLPSHYRDVNGQLYDTIRSTNWHSIICKYQKQAGKLALMRQIERKKIGERPHAVNSLTAMGALSAGDLAFPPHPEFYNLYEDHDGADILLKNFPDAHVVTGQEFTLHLLRVGETNFNGSVMAIYDCGTPHTNTIIVTNLVKISGAK